MVGDTVVEVGIWSDDERPERVWCLTPPDSGFGPPLSPKSDGMQKPYELQTV